MLTWVRNFERKIGHKKNARQRRWSKRNFRAGVKYVIRISAREKKFWQEKKWAIDALWPYVDALFNTYT